MVQMVRYLSHPQVQVDPAIDTRNWSLSEIGRRRITLLATSGKLEGTAKVISSAETKALESARPLSDALGCSFEIREKMHENDRSATGYLPQVEFESVADQFFAKPLDSIRGWETAHAAQRRIVNEVNTCVHRLDEGDVLFVGHGAVGTLLYCHLRDIPISRDHDQIAGGGCFFEFAMGNENSVSSWRLMEELYKTPDQE